LWFFLSGCGGSRSANAFAGPSKHEKTRGRPANPKLLLFLRLSLNNDEWQIQRTVHFDSDWDGRSLRISVNWVVNTIVDISIGYTFGLGIQTRRTACPEAAVRCCCTNRQLQPGRNGRRYTLRAPRQLSSLTVFARLCVSAGTNVSSNQLPCFWHVLLWAKAFQWPFPDQVPMMTNSLSRGRFPLQLGRNSSLCETLLSMKLFTYDPSLPIPASSLNSCRLIVSSGLLCENRSNP
jgi:hypothetical protein